MSAVSTIAAIVAGAILLIASYVWGMNRGQKTLKLEYITSQSLERTIKTFEHQGKSWGCYELES